MFSKKEERPQPPVNPTDEVFPVHLFDDSAAARGIFAVWQFKFDDVLDPDKLNEALSQLFQMDGWRKLGGRFRYRSDGGLELHVPREFTKERPAVKFSKEMHDFPISQHPLASKMPQSTGKIATYPGPREFCSLGSPDGPRSMDDFVYSDAPQIFLHVQTFTDASVVCLTSSHITCDLMGLAAMFESWSSILAGKPEDVIPMVGAREDVFEKLWNPPPKERHVLADKVLNGWRFKYWGIRSLYEARRSDDVESRTLCIPRRAMEKLLQEARSHIKTETTSSEPKPFISESDILTALVVRMQALYQGPNSRRELATIMAVDPRSLVKSVFRQDVAYVQNSPTNVFYFCPADQARDLPLGQLALLVRKSVAAQTSEEQLKAATALSVESMKANQMPVIFGSKDMAAQFMSNWSKGRFPDRIDFSPAIVGDTPPKTPQRKRGHPVYYQTSDPNHNTVSVISSVFVVVGKDYDENTWFSISVPGKMLSDLMDYLEPFDDHRSKL